MHYSERHARLKLILGEEGLEKLYGSRVVVLGRHVLDGMHRGHLQVLLVGLAEADVELAQDIAAGERLFVGNANKGGGDLRVVEVEGLYIHAFFHAFECTSPMSKSRCSILSMRNTVTFPIDIAAGRGVPSCVCWHS